MRVLGHDEQVWFANGAGGDPTRPPGGDTPPVAILHTVLGHESQALLADARRITLHHDFVDVGTLVPVPRTSIGPDDHQLVAAGATSFPIGRAQAVVVEAADGQGQRARLDSRDGRSAELVWPAGESFELVAPFRVHFGVLPVSRGQSVRGEVLGSGDPARPAQEFTLARSPLTYLASADPAWPGYRSTLRIWVDGVEWLEVPSFYAQPADARVFVTREDDEQQTHVRFGDGEHGARLPAGQANVVADYRFGSGAKSPPAGTLTGVQKPPPGLRGVKNPVAAGGGADPDPSAQIRRYAPRSVLAFGRAVSADDHEAIAARAPSVRRARAVSIWDAEQQRTLVAVYVGDDAAAVAAARDALRAAADPNRPRRVLQAQALPVRLSLGLAVAPRYKPAEVAARVRAALLDDERGPFAPLVAQIGDPLFESQLDEVCLAVPGVEAVHELRFDASGAARSGSRLRPPVGGFFTLHEDDLDVSAEESKRG